MKDSKLKLNKQTGRNKATNLYYPPTIFEDHIRYRMMVVCVLAKEMARDIKLKSRKASPDVLHPSIAEDVRNLKARIKRFRPLTPEELKTYLLFRPYLVHGKTTFQAGLSAGAAIFGRSNT
jgi:hypothetical protein